MSRIYTPCLIFLQLLLGQVFAMDAGGANYTQYVWKKPILAATIKTSQSKKRGRGPASTVPSDEIQPEPFKNDIWLNSVFVEDRAGVMNQMKNQFAEWDRIERYRQNWDIESTGLYETPDMGTKKAWFNRMLLRYADKRLTGEIKDAAEGSTMDRVRSVKQALKPDTTAEISQNIKLKFKARVLRMSGEMRVVNPWVECETTFNTRGDINSRVARNFESLGIRSEVNYQISDGQWQASFSKPLTNNITAVLTSAQSDSEMAFVDMDRNTLQLFYNTPF